jgi:hypothetical protein
VGERATAEFESCWIRGAIGELSKFESLDRYVLAVSVSVACP